MTVDEFIKKIKELKKYYHNIGEYSITVHKHDKNQLTCSTTVPINSFGIGFDYTMNQIVLEPSIKLNTHPDVTKDNMFKKVNQYSQDSIRHMSLVASLSKMLNEIPDENVRNKFHEVLKQF